MTRHTQLLGQPQTPAVVRAQTPTVQPPRRAKDVESSVRLITTKAVAELLSVPAGSIRYWSASVRLEAAFTEQPVSVAKNREQSLTRIPAGTSESNG